MSVLVARRSALLTACLTGLFLLALTLKMTGILFAPAAWQLAFAALLLPLSGLLHYASLSAMYDARDGAAVTESLIDGSLALLTVNLGMIALVRGLSDPLAD